MMTDPIADMLTRIRNAVRVEKPIVEIPFSKVKQGLAEVLKKEGFIWDWSAEEAAPRVEVELSAQAGGDEVRLVIRARGAVSGRDTRVAVHDGPKRYECALDPSQVSFDAAGGNRDVALRESR